MGYEYKIQKSLDCENWEDDSHYDLYEDAERALDKLENFRYNRIDEGYLVKKESDLDKAIEYLYYWGNIRYRIMKRPYSTDWVEVL